MVTIKGKPKPFSRSLYNNNDKKGRHAALRYAHQFGYSARNRAEDMKVDLVFWGGPNNEPEIEVEVERRDRKHFSRGEFRYPTVTIPQRKGKLFDSPGAGGLYVAVNHELTHVLVTDFNSIRNSPVIVKNSYVEGQLVKDEPFYDVRRYLWIMKELTIAQPGNLNMCTCYKYKPGKVFCECSVRKCDTCGYCQRVWAARHREHPFFDKEKFLADYKAVTKKTS